MLSNKQLQDIANILRRDSLISTSKAGSGHPTSCLSCAEILSVLYFDEMKIDLKNPFNPNNDEFILSKGHAAPILYSAMYRAKLTDHHPNSLRNIQSPLEGHPIPSSHIPYIKIATGSLGQGLSIGVGMALASKIDKSYSRVYVLLGDSESSEGSVYEALELAVHYKLNNLVAILDINRLGQTNETMFGHNIEKYKKKFNGLGLKTILIDGHNIQKIKKAFNEAKKSKYPTIILAKTYKGKGVSFLENKEGWHGKTLNEEQLQKALEEIPNPEMPKYQIKQPKKLNINIKKIKPEFTKYNLGEKIATREAYGNALFNLSKKDKRVLVVDAEVSNSTFSDKVKNQKETKNQFIETYIAEQNMIGVSLGLEKKRYNVFASTFAAFLSRAHDQIRMCVLSNPYYLTLCGSHAGVSIGQDGPSQMGLEDIALFRATPNCVIFYPSDAISTEKLMFSAYKTPGLKYIRTTRQKTPVIYTNSEDFPIGDFKILKESNKDKAVLVGSGITLHESLKAYEKLKQNKMNVAVVDLYCIKPFNSKKFINFVKEHGNKVIITEDHYKEGGIGEMLSHELLNTGIKITHLAVKEIPHSGKSEELLKKYKIDSNSIIESVKEIV